MTPGNQSFGRPSSEPVVTEHHIEFDGAQLTVRSDIAEINDFVRATYEYMLVSCVTESAGTLDVIRTKAGLSVRSAKTLEVAGDGLEPVLPFLKEEVILQFIRARPDLLWLHAAAVERDGSALLLSGPSGRGKSTLSTLLCETGWRLMSDDIAPLRMTSDEVLPFYQSPLRRIHPGRAIHVDDIGGLERESVPIPAHSIRREPAHVRAIVFPEFVSGANTELARLSEGSAALEILRNARNFVDHKAAAVERVARIARQVTAYRLTYGIPGEAALVLGGVR